MTKALGMVETEGLATSIIIADAMVKTANVHLIGQKEVSQAFYTISIEGDFSSVELAIAKGITIAQEAGALLAFDIIPRPFEETKVFVKG